MISDLIERLGRDVSRRRLSFGRTTMGGSRTDGETVETVRLLIQNGGGSSSVRHGAERATYGIVAYAKAGTDIEERDLFDYDGKTYRIDSKRVPDERPIGDALSYIILGVTREEGIT